MESVLVLDAISKSGLKLLEEECEVGSNITYPTAIIVRSTEVDTDRYPHLVAVARAGSGVNNISVDKATKNGICVFNAPGANANAVAELVFIMLGVYARNINQALKYVQKLKWGDGDAQIVEKNKAKFKGFELRNKILGVIGLGAIGVLVANGGIKRGMRVLGYDAFPTLSNMHRLDSGIEIARRMEEVLAMADMLTVHVPLLESTWHLIGREQIALMKPNCILMNYSRSGIYDDKAVLEAIYRYEVQAFITDFPTKELCSKELRRNGHVICTPHLGASTRESEENCGVIVARQLDDYLKYGVVTNSVNFPTVEVFPSPTTRTRLAVTSRDIPNMIASIAGTFGAFGINIQALTNEGNGEISYNLVDFDVDIPAEIIAEICQLPGVLLVRYLRFKK